MKNLIIILALFFSYSAFSQQSVMNGNVTSDASNDVTVTNKLTVTDSIHSTLINCDSIDVKSKLKSNGSLLLSILGTNNLFLGVNAGRVNSTGYANMFLGQDAGYSNLGGYYNSFMGWESGYANTSAYQNVAIGVKALRSNQTGINNVAIGSSAGYIGTAIAQNVFIGVNAGYNTTGSSNNFIGYLSGERNTSGQYSVSIGDNAMRYSQTGSANVLIGYGSGLGVITNSFNNNTAVGANTIRNVTTGSNNSVFGLDAQRLLTTGANNTAFGYQAGYSNTTGSGNVFLGYLAGKNEAVGSDKLIISNSATGTSLIRGDFPNDSLSIYATNILLSTARLKIGTTTLDSAVTAAGGGHFTGGLVVGGDLTYNLRHGYMTFDNQSLTILVTANIYETITNGTNNLFTVDDADNITITGDTMTIVTNGNYGINFSFGFEGANDKDFNIILVKNHTTQINNKFWQVTKGAGRICTISGFIYAKSLVAGDDLKFRITSTDGSDPTFINGSVYIEKTH